MSCDTAFYHFSGCEKQIMLQKEKVILMNKRIFLEESWRIYCVWTLRERH